VSRHGLQWAAPQGYGAERAAPLSVPVHSVWRERDLEQWL
jgi:hypothetical protein